MLQGSTVESQTTDQAIVVTHATDNARFLFCLLLWWPGFMFGHHKATVRQMIRIDESGATHIDTIKDGGASNVPASRRNMIFAALVAIVVFVIFIGVCASALEDAGDFNCRSTLRCDDEGNCTYVTECD
jgi:hypothetical protein